ATLYHRNMIKGITWVRAARTAEELQMLESFFSTLGFEPGKGSSGEHFRTAPFLAPLGNLEFVTGKMSATPEILIEVTGLEAVRTVAENWVKKNSAEGGRKVSVIAQTHWNSRLFTAEPVPGMVFGFWESENVHHGKPVAIEGDLSAAGMRFGIVVSRWNAVITDRLLQGALDALLRSGAKKDAIRVVRVPGSWEIPGAARLLAESKNVDAIVTLGVLLRGETAHYEAIYTEVSRGIGQSQQDTGVPHAFGVLTCETLEQALDRAGLKMGNKGFEAALAAIEMAAVKKKIVTPTVTDMTADL
ncbi:MAG TPA: 6,7-dimethyl-8-ribityllumazine synthase, partial [Acidobacteriaceae bacterium]|nr:6,7-dimethyl-8-ribityllumazine synthase [Acidobacteriaceae bacterium]